MPNAEPRTANSEQANSEQRTAKWSTLMTSQQRFLLGLAAGTAAMILGSRAVRGRRAIEFAGRNVVITGG
jgi:hypothetical protein